VSWRCLDTSTHALVGRPRGRTGTVPEWTGPPFFTTCLTLVDNEGSPRSFPWDLDRRPWHLHHPFLDRLWSCLGDDARLGGTRAQADGVDCPWISQDTDTAREAGNCPQPSPSTDVRIKQISELFVPKQHEHCTCVREARKERTAEQTHRASASWSFEEATRGPSDFLSNLTPEVFRSLGPGAESPTSKKHIASDRRKQRWERLRWRLAIAVLYSRNELNVGQTCASRKCPLPE